MTSELFRLLAELAASPWLQGLVAALATFVLEDPTTVGAGLLVADRKMAFETALIGVAAGIAIGDLLLYAAGRAIGPRLASWRRVTPDRLGRAAGWFRRNLVTAVVLSRFVPGMRLPTYVAAGVLRAPVWRFAIVVVTASLVWTLVLLRATIALGELALPTFGSYRWPIALTAVMLLVVAQRRALGVLGRRAETPPPQVVSRFELWSPWLFYLPVFCYWMWLSLRYRGVTLPTAANPSIYSGGWLGESKSQILDLVPEPHRRWLAPYVTVDVAAGATPDELTPIAAARLASAGIRFPVVAKPDTGQRGAGVQPLADHADLRRYLAGFPAGHRVVLQALAGGEDDGRPHEAGVLYWRLPGSDRGEISSMTLKSMPAVVGDGSRTIRQLIASDPRARRLADVYLARFGDAADRVPASGERLPLVFAGNHCQGAVFINASHLLTPALADRIDGVARAMPEFHFGRFDIRFSDLDAFRRGRDLEIIEINGAGGEATHIWDASTRLVDAYRALFEQFRVLFAIGSANRRRGHRPIGPIRFLGDALAYRRLVRHYPATR